MGVFRRKFDVEVYINQWTESLQRVTRVFGPHTSMSDHFGLDAGVIPAQKGMFRIRLTPVDDGAVFIGGRQPGAAVIPHGAPLSEATSALQLGDVADQYDQGRPQSNVLTMPFTLQMLSTLYTSLAEKGDRGYGSELLTSTAMTANAAYCHALGAAVQHLGPKALAPDSMTREDWSSLPNQAFYMRPVAPIGQDATDPVQKTLQRLFTVGSLARVCFGGLDLRNTQEPSVLRWWVHDQLLLELSPVGEGSLEWSAWYVYPAIRDTEPQLRRQRSPLMTPAVAVPGDDPAAVLRALVDSVIPALRGEPAHLMSGSAVDISSAIDFWEALRTMFLSGLETRAQRVTGLLDQDSPDSGYASLVEE